MNQRIQRILIGILSFTLYPSLCAESQDRQFYDAVRAEASGDLQLAASLYEEILLQHQSANLHANLGNIYYGLSDLGRAILHLRKSLLLNPDNRECRSSLASALKKSGLQAMPDRTNPLFAENLQIHWGSSFAVLFWFGLLSLLWIFPWNIRSSSFWIYAVAWKASLFFLTWGWMECHQQGTLLKREVIVLSSPPSPSNPPEKIPLRRFASEDSDPNTMLTTGTSLLIDMNNAGNPRIHQSPDGTIWYLVRSLDGFDKGWLIEKEFRKIIE